MEKISSRGLFFGVPPSKYLSRLWNLRPTGAGSVVSVDPSPCFSPLECSLTLYIPCCRSG